MPFIGAIEYHYLNAGIHWADGGGAFGLVPKTIWQEKIRPDADNRIPIHINCLLIKANGKTILVDTGYGNKLTPKQTKIFGLDYSLGTLTGNLAQLGLGPADVDMVINTHLHADHCGGNTLIDPADQRVKPAFPNAEYLIQRLEWADAITTNERTRATYLPENFEPLRHNGQLTLLSGNTAVTGGVRTVTTRGHTRAHQSILLESEGQLGLFLGDMASLSYNFERTAWVAAFDVEPLENIETKRQWQHWAVETGAVIMLQHDPHFQTGQLHPNGRHFKFVPLGGSKTPAG